MSYRAGHHSTSDDSARYRPAAEAAAWRARDPAQRFGRWISGLGWWDAEKEAALRREARAAAVAREGEGG